MAQSLFFCFCTQATPPERGELSSLKAPTTKKNELHYISKKLTAKQKTYPWPFRCSAASTETACRTR